MTDKQQEQFIQFYYWLYWDTSKKWTGKLPTIFDGDEELHRNMWKLQLQKILGKTKSKQTYTHRGWRTETYLEYVFSWLWLAYWPTVLKYNDVINNDWNKTRG